MMRAGRTPLVLLMSIVVSVASPVAASDFVVVTATGVLEPAALESGHELEKGSRLSLEPWGRALVRETSGCGLTHVIVGASEHELAPAEDCSAVVQPGDVAALLQQGAAFAGRLSDSTEGATALVQMIVNEPCVFLARVSEEGSNSRRCPSGYALRGVRCSGEFCGDKDLVCCPYLEGAPDPEAKELSSRVISEEFPNTFKTKGFLNGLACNGAHCDNIRPFNFKSSRIKKTSECDWSPYSSDQPDAWLDCPSGQLISGIRCRGDYCEDVSVLCCQTQAP